MADEGKKTGCGCSFLGCIGGCVGTLALLGAGLFVAILFLPDIAARGAEYVLRQHTERPMELPSPLRDPAVLARVEEKLIDFGRQIRESKGQEISLTFTEDEVNGWLADEIEGRRDRLPIPLQNAHVTLLKGQMVLRAVLRGEKVRSLVPESAPAVFKRIVGRMNYVNLSLRLGLGVRSGRLHFQIRQASLGSIPVPLQAAHSVADTFRPDRSVQFRLQGFRLGAVEVEADRLRLTGLAVAEEN